MKPQTDRISAAQYLRMVGAADKKNPRRQYQGMVNREQGDAFEDFLTAACEYYASVYAAEIEKTPEPTRQLGAKDESGRFSACYEKKAQPDYKGTLAGGRSIVFEAKSTTRERMEQQYVTEEQSKRLNRHDALGALCFVVITFGFVSFYRVPWHKWRDMKKHYGRGYVTPADLQQYKLLFGGPGVLMILDGITHIKGNTKS